MGAFPGGIGSSFAGGHGGHFSSNCWVLDVAIWQVGSPISASLSPHLLPEEPGVRWTSPTGGWVELPVRTSFLVENAKNQVNQSKRKNNSQVMKPLEGLEKMLY